MLGHLAVDGVNSDNGDLIDLIMELVEPPMPECQQFRVKSLESYRQDYMQCFRYCVCHRGRARQLRPTVTRPVAAMPPAAAPGRSMTGC